MAVSLKHCRFLEVECATPEESKMFLRMRIEEDMRKDLRKIPHQTALGSLGLDLLQDTGVYDGSVTKEENTEDLLSS